MCAFPLKDFMAAGGFAQIQQEENEKAEHEKEKQELVRLQRESLEYQKTIRHQETIIRLHKYVEAVSWLITLIISSILLFSKG